MRIRAVMRRKTLVALCLGFALAVLAGCNPFTRTIRPSGESPRNGNGNGEAIAPRTTGAEDPASGGVELAMADEAPTLPAPTPAPAGGDVGAALDEVRRDQERLRTVARAYLEKAKEREGALDYAEAERLLRKALENDPGLADASVMLNRVLMLQGKRRGMAPALSVELARLRTVESRQRLASARRAVDDAQRLFTEGRLDEAERVAERARELLEWFSYEEDVEPLKKDALGLLARIRAGRIEQGELHRAGLERRALEAAERSRELRDAEEKERVDILLGRVHNAILVRDFDKALELVDAVLEAEPENTTALRYRRRALEARKDFAEILMFEHREETTRLLDEDLFDMSTPRPDAVNWPTREDWEVVRDRSRTIAAEISESLEVQQVKSILNSTTVNFNFQDNSLAVVRDVLRQFTNLNFTIDPNIEPGDYKVTMRVQNMRLREFLDHLMENTQLKYVIREGPVIEFTDKPAVDIIFDIYNVTDIITKIRNFPGPQIQIRSRDQDAMGGGGPGSLAFGDVELEEEEPVTAESIAELVMDSTGGTMAWEEPKKIVAHRGQLLVWAPADLHLRIRKILEELRRDMDIFVVIEARFIDINDDFLSDIGVDSRALGVQSTWGTPFGAVIHDDMSGGINLGFVTRGSPADPQLVMGQERVAGRIQHIVDGFAGAIAGDRLAFGANKLSGLTMQLTLLDPFQINAIFRAAEEKSDTRTMIAPRITAHNRQRVFVSQITQRAYIADYELVSGGTGLTVIEVADPIVQTFQEGIILDVNPVVSHDKKYVTLDVRPTLAVLEGGVISTIRISLGTVTAAAFQVPIGVPQVQLQQAYTSVTVPDGGTVLLGGFRSLNERRWEAYIPLLGKVPLLKNLFRRKAEISEKRSLVILLTANIFDLRQQEKERFN